MSTPNTCPHCNKSFEPESFDLGEYVTDRGEKFRVVEQKAIRGRTVSIKAKSGWKTGWCLTIPLITVEPAT